MIEGLRSLIEYLSFEVASFRGLTDDYVNEQSPGWLFSQYEMVMRAKWQEWTWLVTATEIAVSRSLDVALSGKKKVKLPPLPSWSEVSGESEQKTPSDFVRRIQEANRDRREKIVSDNGD